ncbi:MAG: hypothetical protein ACTSWY_05460 [Promethearchaeota archaeon]
MKKSEKSMGKCPYCKKEIHLKEFFNNIEMHRFKAPSYDFSGEEFFPGMAEEKTPMRGTYMIKMFSCPYCDTILGFSSK